eukprot:gnl/TRDRNA2_/TRDRNA2_171602_c0_seq2.p1 gnl/TRDRNA2_/TRDRNA2_171602_c0~~gnl/TRDRNA2_/TRDRNA2_171602_c0_seq2.p1  ORF type:complete len:681 (+),score=113.14 gnl/TRDRNA2_/TRDRNA2_171602_c0_seq2:61-2103(+)
MQDNGSKKPTVGTGHVRAIYSNARKALADPNARKRISSEADSKSRLTGMIDLIHAETQKVLKKQLLVNFWIDESKERAASRDMNQVSFSDSELNIEPLKVRSHYDFSPETLDTMLAKLMIPSGITPHGNLDSVSVKSIISGLTDTEKSLKKLRALYDTKLDDLLEFQESLKKCAEDSKTLVERFKTMVGSMTDRLDEVIKQRSAELKDQSDPQKDNAMSLAKRFLRTLCKKPLKVLSKEVDDIVKLNERLGCPPLPFDPVPELSDSSDGNSSGSSDADQGAADVESDNKLAEEEEEIEEEIEAEEEMSEEKKNNSGGAGLQRQATNLLLDQCRGPTVVPVHHFIMQKNKTMMLDKKTRIPLMRQQCRTLLEMVKQEAEQDTPAEAVIHEEAAELVEPDVPEHGASQPAHDSDVDELCDDISTSSSSITYAEESTADDAATRACQCRSCLISRQLSLRLAGAAGPDGTHVFTSLSQNLHRTLSLRDVTIEGMWEARQKHRWQLGMLPCYPSSPRPPCCHFAVKPQILVAPAPLKAATPAPASSAKPPKPPEFTGLLPQISPEVQARPHPDSQLDFNVRSGPSSSELGVGISQGIALPPKSPSPDGRFFRSILLPSKSPSPVGCPAIKRHLTSTVQAAHTKFSLPVGTGTAWLRRSMPQSEQAGMGEKVEQRARVARITLAF